MLNLGALKRDNLIYWRPTVCYESIYVHRATKAT